MLGGVLRRVLGIGNAEAELREGISAYDRGDFAAAERRLAAALRARPRDPTARYYAALTARKSGHHRAALEHLERATEIDPENVDYCYQAAATEYLLGNASAAWKYCERVLERVHDHLPSHMLMSHIALPGSHYSDVLRLVHHTLRPRTYVEIGVFMGDSIALALPETRAIGIDPAPNIRHPLPASTTIHAMTSDEYFSKHDVSAELGGLPVDLAFIDGLHLFEQALRDFVNLEKLCTPESIVLFHDCYPLDRRTAERTQTTAFSSGDVWRAILALKKYRPELRIQVIATPPTGLAVVGGLVPASTKLAHNFDAIISEFMAVDYGALEAEKPRLLNLLPNDPEQIARLLGEFRA